MNIILFVHDNYWVSNILLKAYSRHLLAGGHSLRVVIRGRQSSLCSRFFYNLYSITHFFLYRAQITSLGYTLNDFATPTYQICRRMKVDYFYVQKNSFNSPAFASLISNSPPDICFSLGWTLKFPVSLINLLGPIINYHDGLLPSYKGVYATHWSIYNVEKYTGYSFNLVTTDIDEGKVLVSNHIPVSTNKSVFHHELLKVDLACQDLPAILNNLLENSSYSEQHLSSLGSTYYSHKDYFAITNIHDPSLLDVSEINKRAQIFGSVNIKTSDGWLLRVKTVEEGRLFLFNKFSFKVLSNSTASISNLPLYILSLFASRVVKLIKRFLV